MVVYGSELPRDNIEYGAVDNICDNSRRLDREVLLTNLALGRHLYGDR